MKKIKKKLDKLECKMDKLALFIADIPSNEFYKIYYFNRKHKKIEKKYKELLQKRHEL